MPSLTNLLRWISASLCLWVSSAAAAPPYFCVLSDDPATCSVFCDRTTIPAQGFFGGEPGAKGALLINGKAPANPKAEQVLLPGDLIELFMPGGGGFGPPAERDPALRARDRLEGYATT